MACCASPFVSIVVSTHNRAQFLERSLSSVFCQSYLDWELIVVDDGSTDDSQKVISMLLGRYKASGGRNHCQSIRIENSGVSVARNIGVKRSKGKWIAFLDSDDEWLPEKLEKQVSYILAHREEFSICHTDEYWKKNGLELNPKSKHKKQSGRIFRQAVRLCPLSMSSTMIKKEDFLKLGGFKEGFLACEDYDLWLRALCKYDVLLCPEKLSIQYADHRDRLSKNIKIKDHYRVQSLIEVLKNESLSEDERLLAEEVLTLKLSVLKKGYERRNNRRGLEQVSIILKQVQCLNLSDGLEV